MQWLPWLYLFFLNDCQVQISWLYADIDKAIIFVHIIFDFRKQNTKQFTWNENNKHADT